MSFFPLPCHTFVFALSFIVWLYMVSIFLHLQEQWPKTFWSICIHAVYYSVHHTIFRTFICVVVIKRTPVIFFSLSLDQVKRSFQGNRRAKIYTEYSPIAKNMLFVCCLVRMWKKIVLHSSLTPFDFDCTCYQLFVQTHFYVIINI